MLVVAPILNFKRKIFLIGVVAVLLTGLQTVWAQPVPQPMSPPRLVNDYAHLFSGPQQQALEDSLVAFDRATSTQIAVVTVNDLEGYPAAEYATRILEQWGVGSREHNNGVVMLVKPRNQYGKGEVFIAVGYGLDLMLAILSVVQGIVSTIITQSGVSGAGGTTLPQDIIDKINQVGFWDSIPLWAVTLIGGLFITVLSFLMILTVYSRMFKVYMYTALAPIPLSTFAGEPTSNVGKNFLRSYAGVCLEGAVIALACIIFSVMAAAPPAVDSNVSAVTAVWSYVGELIFNLLVLVGAVRMSDRIIKELMGL